MHRRGLIGAGLSLGALALGRPLLAAVPTPRQSTGPFYPETRPLDSDADLVQIGEAQGRAQGDILWLSGRVLDSDGRPLPNVPVEIWQANRFGRYNHPRDSSGRTLDPNFQGFGVSVSDADGIYRFRTIRPGAYSGRTPHIHFAVRTSQDNPLITQMYFAGEPLNGQDLLYRRLSDAERTAVTVAFRPGPEGAPPGRTGTFDIRLA